MSEPAENTVETHTRTRGEVDLETHRGSTELITFIQAMSHELKDNHHKGHWLDGESTKETFQVDQSTEEMPYTYSVPRSNEDLLGDALYHLAKLGLAMRVQDRQGVLEYAADVGNCVMFIADKFEALNLDFLHAGPIEYDEEHLDIARQTNMAKLKIKMNNLAADLLTGSLPPPPSKENTDHPEKESFYILLHLIAEMRSPFYCDGIWFQVKYNHDACGWYLHVKDDTHHISFFMPRDVYEDAGWSWKTWLQNAAEKAYLEGWFKSVQEGVEVEVSIA